MSVMVDMGLEICDEPLFFRQSTITSILPVAKSMVTKHFEHGEYKNMNTRGWVPKLREVLGWPVDHNLDDEGMDSN